MTFRAGLLTGFAGCLAAALAGVAAAAPASRWQIVSYGGLSVRVPAAWPVIRFTANPAACPRLDVHAVYLGTPGPDPACPADLVGTSEAVMIGPLRPGGRQPGWQGAGHQRLAGPARPQAGSAGRLMLTAENSVSRTITDVLPRSGMRVWISYRTDRALALAIQASIRVSHGARPVPTAGASLTVPGARAARPQRGALPASGDRLAGQGVFAGGGFDTCAAPGAAAMTSWLSSSYRAVGIYIGGVNRACAQVNLTPSWLAGIQAQGWHYVPLYPGLQSRCVMASGDATISDSRAAAQGTAAADDAAAQAAGLSIPPKTPLIFDMEAYRPACDRQVVTFLSAWDRELHARGYRAGVYESFTNIGALVAAASSITEPDVIWYADWDGMATTTSSYMPAGWWTTHARLHQYRGGHLEVHGGVAITVDSDQLDVDLGGAPVPSGNAGFRIAVAINKNGTAEWFARSAGGSLTHSWQRPVGSLTWSAARAVGRSPATFASNPAVAAQADGTLTVFARDGSGLIQHAWQQAGFPNGWEWGAPLPAPPVPALTGTDPAALLLPRGTVALYQTAASGAVLVTVQRRPNANGHWVAWGNIGGSCMSAPVPVVDGHRKVDVFCVAAGGSMAMIQWNGRTWGNWSTLPGSPADLTGTPAVVVDGSGQTELFASTGSGGLDYAWQAPGGAWTWEAPLQGPGGIGGSPSAATWPAGQVVVYARLASGAAGYVRQQGTAGSAAWSGWSVIGSAPGGAMTGSPAGWLNSSGAASVAMLDGSRNVAVASNAGSGWSGWTEVGGGF
ncbi:MAG TPA: glycoside hydrolase domain-containing protein [Streptosporangiaceae bacterium]